MWIQFFLSLGASGLGAISGGLIVFYIQKQELKIQNKIKQKIALKSIGFYLVNTLSVAESIVTEAFVFQNQMQIFGKDFQRSDGNPIDFKEINESFGKLWKNKLKELKKDNSASIILPDMESKLGSNPFQVNFRKGVLNLNITSETIVNSQLSIKASNDSLYTKIIQKIPWFTHFIKFKEKESKSDAENKPDKENISQIDDVIQKILWLMKLTRSMDSVIEEINLIVRDINKERLIEGASFRVEDLSKLSPCSKYFLDDSFDIFILAYETYTNISDLYKEHIKDGYEMVLPKRFYQTYQACKDIRSRATKIINLK